MSRRTRAAHRREWLRLFGVLAVQVLALGGLVLIAQAIVDYGAEWRTTDFPTAIEGGRP